jgi:hypothetical protein
MSDESTTTDEDEPVSCVWCGASFEPGDASYGVHIAGLDSSRLHCPRQDVRAIAEQKREAAYGGIVYYVGALL